MKYVWVTIRTGAVETHLKVPPENASWEPKENYEIPRVAGNPVEIRMAYTWDRNIRHSVISTRPVQRYYAAIQNWEY